MGHYHFQIREGRGRAHKSLAESRPLLLGCELIYALCCCHRHRRPDISAGADQAQHLEDLSSLGDDAQGPEHPRRLLLDVARAVKTEWNRQSLWKRSPEDLSQTGLTAEFLSDMADAMIDMEMFELLPTFKGCTFEPLTETFIPPF